MCLVLSCAFVAKHAGHFTASHQALPFLSLLCCMLTIDMLQFHVETSTHI